MAALLTLFPTPERGESCASRLRSVGDEAFADEGDRVGLRGWESSDIVEIGVSHRNFAANWPLQTLGYHALRHGTG